MARDLQKAAGHVSYKKKHRNSESKIPWSCEFSVEGRSVDEDDSVVKGNEAWARGGQVADAVGKAFLLLRDMRIWQGDSSKRLIENLKHDLVLVVFKRFLYLDVLFSFFSFNFECVF